MDNSNVVEPPDHLYQEGNIIGKYFKQRKKPKKPFDKKRKEQEVKKDKKIHKYQKDSLGSLIDIEV